MAERLMAAGLASSLGDASAQITVSSAGTRCYDGSPMHPWSAGLLADRGGDADAFLSRSLTGAFVDDADLVLTAERAHKDAVVTLRPSAARRTFTLREFAWLLELVDVDSLPTEPLAVKARAMVHAAAEQRGSRQPASLSDLDIPDPVGEPAEVFTSAAELIDRAVTFPLSILVRTPAR